MSKKALPLLIDQGYVPKDIKLSITTISFILFQIAAASHSATDSDSIKAAAFLLEELAIQQQTDHISTRIATTLEDQMRKLGNIFEDLKEKEVAAIHTAVSNHMQDLEAIRQEMTKASQEIKEGREGLEGTTNALENACGELAEVFQRSTAGIKDQIDAFTEISNPITTRSEAPKIADPSPKATPDIYSYADATRQHLPSTHATNISRNNKKRRQFTIHPTTNTDDMGLAELSELEIIAKLKLALDNTAVRKESMPHNLRFVSVRRMKKGGVIFDVNSDEAAVWLRKDDVQADFTKRFSAKATVQGYQFRALAEFVPISLDVDSTYSIFRLEKDNNLPPGSITEIAWIKKVERRLQSQQVAHLRISFDQLEGANNAIEKRLSIQGKWVKIRQMTLEPQQCAKCQLYGHDNNKGAPHFARDCTWIHDVCRLCGGHHRTSNCTANMPDGAECANCKVTGKEYRNHTVHAWTCPTFLETKRRFDISHGSQQYKFFVTEDTKTWETNEPPSTQPVLNTQNSSSSQFPMPPPNQLQRQPYRKPNHRLTPKTATRQPGGVRVSASNAIPLGNKQAKLNDWIRTADKNQREDTVDREIDQNNGLIAGAHTNESDWTRDTDPTRAGPTNWAEDHQLKLSPPAFFDNQLLQSPTDSQLLNNPLDLTDSRQYNTSPAPTNSSALSFPLSSTGSSRTVS